MNKEEALRGLAKVAIGSAVGIVLLRFLTKTLKMRRHDVSFLATSAALGMAITGFLDSAKTPPPDPTPPPTSFNPPWA